MVNEASVAVFRLQLYLEINVTNMSSPEHCAKNDVI